MPKNYLILPQNTKGRDFVVGDIHGAYELFIEGLKQVNFDEEKDRLISVGDLIDRGPNSVASLFFLQEHWFYAIRGNHEDMYLRAVNPDGSLNPHHLPHGLKNGMAWILQETSEKRAEIRKAFEKLPIAIETITTRGTVGFVHAEVPSGMEWHEFLQRLERNDQDFISHAFWSRERIENKDRSGVFGIGRLFVGHTPQENTTTRLGNCYYIDTGAVFSEFLPLDDKRFFLTLADIRGMSIALEQTPPRLDPKLNTVTKLHDRDNHPFGDYARPPSP